MKKEEYEKLQRAATMYRNLTGESVDLSEVKVDQPEEDAKAKAQKLEDNLKRESEIQARKEASDQELRRIKVEQAKGSGDVQPENPGPGQPAMVTERAHAAGVSRAGEEPDIARGGRGRSK